MKRFSLILALLLMVAMPMMAERVTPETAQKAAKTFMNNNGAKSAQLTDLSRAAGFSNLYIFNGEKGFVVMAADNCAQPILGYSLTGQFVAEHMPSNLSAWLQGYNDEIQYAIENQLRATAETTKLWKDLIDGNSKAAKATVVVAALIQSTWDQDPGYNDLCPYDNSAGELTVTGCVATAMAQILRYWEYPSHGVSSHSYNHSSYGTQSVNFASATYDWVNMPLHSSNAEIAKLMYHCGVSVNMDYDISANGGSGAYSSDIPSALKNYFIYKTSVSYKAKSSYSSTNWNNLLKTELNAGRPVEYSGSGTAGGHAFVCDGYDNSNYFHFNWGWSGTNDGFFSLSSLNPGSGGSGGGSYSFTQNQTAVIGIQPKDCTTSSPTNFSVTTESRNAILTWSAVSNASAYSIYRNGFLIANTTNTTYTDSNLSYGNYDYYIKSRDTNGAASSPSTTVTVAIEPIPSNLTATPFGNGATLSWTNPTWCAPQTDNEVLTYGDGEKDFAFGYGGGTNMYFGHRYPASMINTNKVLYKVSFYASETGAFTLRVYTSSAGNSKPQSSARTQSYTATGVGWNDIVLSTPLQLNASRDLWVFIYDPEGKEYPLALGEYSGSDGSYITYDPYNPTTAIGTQDGYAILIRTYIADASFTYNLYDNDNVVASNLTGTSYTITSNLATNTVHQFTLRTNFNNGVTNASNMAAFAIGTASLPSLVLGPNDKLTITAGSTLTVSGTLSNSVADNLVLEDGAQLINNSNGVKATVKKDIDPYTRGQSNGWYLIASPVTESITPSAGNGLLNYDYDLYSYNQSEALEWQNCKSQSFDLNNRGGYLYASSDYPTLSFSGTLAANVEATPLTYDNNATVKGFNLVGNPYPCNANVNKSFYVLNTDGSDFILGSNPVPPCTAILVQANGANQSVIFSKASSKSSPSLTLSVAQAETDNVLDRVRINLDSDESLEKYTMRKSCTKLFIPQNGQDFAVAAAHGANEMPIHFKAAQDGTYTLSFEIENAEIGYLHLIDNLTGEDIDFLATPNYIFETQKDGMASRFRLVFNAE